MRQAIMNEPGVIEIRDVTEPVPGPGQVRIRVRRIGVCGSDIHVWHGKHPYTGYPVVQGHEFSGVVESTGEGVTEPAPAQKVTALPQVVCGECGPCRRGDYHICDVLRVQGFQAPGCAQELFVTEAEKVVGLPESFTFEQGALVEPTAVAVHAVTRAPDLGTKNVAVLGAGPIGNLVAQTARARGANVLITDVSGFRLDVARRCGLEATSNPREENLRAAVERVFGRQGLEVVFECVGIEETLTAAVETVGKGGTIVVVGVFAVPPRVNVGLVQDRELNIHGTLMYRREDYVEAVALIGDGKIATAPLESKHFPLAEYADAYAFIEEQHDRIMKVFIDLQVPVRLVGEEGVEPS